MGWVNSSKDSLEDVECLLILDLPLIEKKNSNTHHHFKKFRNNPQKKNCVPHLPGDFTVKPL